MRLSIAAKLFLGFIVIIAVNASFLSIVSRLTSLTSAAAILKKQNEIKNRLVEASTASSSQERSRVIFENLGKEESIENFHKAGVRILVQLDSIRQALDEARWIDSSSHVSADALETLHFLEAVMGNSVQKHALRYNAAFETLVTAHKAGNTVAILSADSTMETSLALFRQGLVDADSLIERQNFVYIDVIENRIHSVTRLALAAIFGIAIFSLVFGFFFSRVMSRSLRRLKDSTSAIGQGDFSFDPAGYPRDEIGDLAVAFHQMASDLKRTQNELIHKRRLAAIGEVVASVNHEINNPLMIISGNAQFLEITIDKGDISDAKQRIRTIIEETERISKVTKKLREIRNPVVEDYTTSGERMINLDKSTLEN